MTHKDREFLAQYGGFGGAMKRSAELQSLPEARVTEGVSIDDYSTRGGPPGLRPRRKPGERRGKSAFFVGTGDRMSNGTPTAGGVFQESLKRCSTTLFHYLSHSSWVAPDLIGLPRADPGKSGRTRATPTKSGGSCGPDSGPVFHAPIRPHAGSLSSLLIPAGRLGSEALTRRRQALPLSLVYSRARRSE